MNIDISSSIYGDLLVQKDVCFEAIRLTSHILDHPTLPNHHANSLMALMHFQASRFDSRIDTNGKLLTLREQNRNTWDKNLIALGVKYLDRATEDSVVTEYYLQASIAGVHCLSVDHQSTDWKTILRLYNLLQKINSSKVIALNRIVALSRAESPSYALVELEKLHDEKLDAYYLYHAIKGGISLQLGEKKMASEAYQMAATLGR